MSVKAMLCSGARLFFAAICVLGISEPARGEVFIAPSGSMKPTLLVGDNFVSVPVSFAEVQRGDIVTFRHPVNASMYIKRLIGLPGDTVQMKDGILFLNGQEVPRVRDGTLVERFEPQGPMDQYPRCENGPVGEGGACTASRFIETLPPTEGFPLGRSYRVLDIQESSFGDNTDLFTVPKGHFFVLGDNRDDSQDSRFSHAVGGMGFVPSQNLIGRVDYVLSSISAAPGWTLRDVK